MKIDYRKQKGLGFHQVLITTKQADRNYCILQGIVRESKRDPAISQAPIITKPEVQSNYDTISQLLAVTFNV